jgi:GAF domain-containing protein
MALPLIVAGDVIGALTIQSAVENAFTEADITSLQAMADQLAMAVDNARLRVELEEARRELAALSQR